MGFKDWLNQDTPAQKAEVATGLKNLNDWMGRAQRPYEGPWPSPHALMDDDRYAQFLAQPDVAQALVKRAEPEIRVRPRRAPEEPPVPTAEPDGPEFDDPIERAPGPPVDEHLPA